MATFLDGIPLQDLFFVGLVEYFPEDLAVLAELLRWNNVDMVYLNSNKAYRTQFEPITEDVKEEITKLNKKDVALYQEAVLLRNERQKKLCQ